MTAVDEMRPDDFIPTVMCWWCHRDLDALSWEPDWIGNAWHPVCMSCQKERGHD